MIDVMQDVEVLENALIALDEGASDEKRSAIYSLQSMLQRKQVEVAYRSLVRYPGPSYSLSHEKQSMGLPAHLGLMIHS